MAPQFRIGEPSLRQRLIVKQGTLPKARNRRSAADLADRARFANPSRNGRCPAHAGADEPAFLRDAEVAAEQSDRTRVRAQGTAPRKRQIAQPEQYTLSQPLLTPYRCRIT